jgi:nucleotide-binding universal stress UspA family protein
MRRTRRRSPPRTESQPTAALNRQPVVKLALFLVKTPVIHRILLGFDGSASALQALVFADALAERLHAQLHIIAVAQPDALPTEVDVRSTIEYARLQCRQALRLARLKLSQPARVRIVVGDPARQILRYAQAHGIEHIVIGHRRRALLGYARISSIVRQVTALAPCPVTIVPAKVVRTATGRHAATRGKSRTARMGPATPTAALRS